MAEVPTVTPDAPITLPEVKATTPPETGGKSGVTWHWPNIIHHQPRPIPDVFITPPTTELLQAPETTDVEEVVKPAPHRQISKRRVLLGAAGAGLVALAGTQVVPPAAEAFLNALPKNNPLMEYANDNSSVTHVIEQQAPYSPEELQKGITKQQVEKKYDVKLLDQHEAAALPNMHIPDVPNQPDWTEAELKKFDIILANTPPKLIGEINGYQRSFFIGTLVGESNTDTAAGACVTAADCGGSASGFIADGGLVSISRAAFDSGDYVITPQQLTMHELTHEADDISNGALDAGVQKPLGNHSYMNLPEFTDNSTVKITDSSTAWAIRALKSFAADGKDLKNPYLNSAEGLAELAQLYVQGYPKFIMSIGWALNGKGTGYYHFADGALPDNLSWFQTEFPQADALYGSLRNIFGGYEYTSDGRMMKTTTTETTSLGNLGVATIDGRPIGVIDTEKMTTPFIVTPTAKAA